MTTAADYFAAKLAFETDAADVADALADGDPGFTLIDARNADAYAAGHIPGALNRPERAAATARHRSSSTAGARAATARPSSRTRWPRAATP